MKPKRQETKTDNLTIRCLPALKNRVTERAKKDGRSVASEAEILVTVGLEALEKNEALVASVLAGKMNIDPALLSSVRP